MKRAVVFACMLVIPVCYPLKTSAQQANTTIAVTPESREKKAETVEISAYDNKIIVTNAPVGSKIEIYSVVGIRVKELPIKQPTGEYPVNIAKGYYIVRIGEIVRKVAIR